VQTIAVARTRPRAELLSACLPVIEGLEDRRLLSTTTVQTLPFSLDFSSDRGELLDKDGQGTGFTRVQANKNGTQYQANLIDLDTAGGVLKMTTSGTSTSGTNGGTTDNTMVNGLETEFDGTVSTGFEVTARLKGPLGYLNAAYDQGGIFLRPGSGQLRQARGDGRHEWRRAPVQGRAGRRCDASERRAELQHRQLLEHQHAGRAPRRHRIERRRQRLLRDQRRQLSEGAVRLDA